MLRSLINGIGAAAQILRTGWYIYAYITVFSRDLRH